MTGIFINNVFVKVTPLNTYYLKFITLNRKTLPATTTPACIRIIKIKTFSI